VALAIRLGAIVPMRVPRLFVQAIDRLLLENVRATVHRPQRGMNRRLFAAGDEWQVDVTVATREGGHQEKKRASRFVVQIVAPMNEQRF